MRLATTIEIVRTRYLTDTEIKQVEKERFADKLRAEQREEELYKNRNHPFRSSAFSRRETFQVIAGASAAASSLLLPTPTQAQTEGVGAGRFGTLIGKFISPEPQFVRRETPKREAIQASAQIASIADVPQIRPTIQTAIKSSDAGQEENPSVQIPEDINPYQVFIFYFRHYYQGFILGKKTLSFYTVRYEIYGNFIVYA